MKIINALMRVAPKGEGFGIRIALTRTSQGVWLGEGWASAGDLERLKAITCPTGWWWETRELAESAIATLNEDVKAHGFEKGRDA